MTVEERTDGKMFQFKMVFIRLDWEELTSYGQKHFRETNNHLCKVSNV